MVTEIECIKILNNEQVKYSKEQIKLIRDLLISLATIEYEHQNQYTNN
jgi:hypothetical protein